MNIGMYSHISTNTTTIVKANPGKLLRIVLTEALGDDLTIYDNATAATGTVIGVLKKGIDAATYEFGCVARNGIVVVTTGTTHVTVVFDN